LRPKDNEETTMMMVKKAGRPMWYKYVLGITILF
jgi:hypothetical protein